MKKLPWIDELVKYESFGDVPVLVLAPHEGVSLVRLGSKMVKIGERGTGELAVRAARHIGGSCIISHVPRMEADFARDPNLLGKGAGFRIGVGNRRVVLKGHINPLYKKLLKDFHKKIKEFSPRFIISFHRMHGRDADVRLGFGKERQYIGGTENALLFKRQLVKNLSLRNVSLDILVSKIKLTGESEFLLNTHYKGRLAALVEFSSLKGFDLKNGRVNEYYGVLAESIAELALEWVKK